MLSRARATTYIFVAIFVLVIMLVAVPAKEKMLRQGQRDTFRERSSMSLA